MLYIISPTKTMKTTTHYKPSAMPQLWEKAELLLANIKMLTVEDIMHFMHVKEALAIQTKQRFDQLSLHENGYCAIEAYDGLQFKYMQMEDLAMSELSYLQEHLRILSAFYGIVRPFDSIQPYRLEMQCKLKVQDYNDLYAYWQDTLAKVLLKEVHTHKEKYLLNLSSKEYEKAIRPYIPKEQWIDVIFQVEKKGKRKVEATQAKMARGRMVHFLAQRQVETLAEVYQFQEDGYQLDKERTGNQQIVFYKKG